MLYQAILTSPIAAILFLAFQVFRLHPPPAWLEVDLNGRTWIPAKRLLTTPDISKKELWSYCHYLALLYTFVLIPCGFVVWFVVAVVKQGLPTIAGVLTILASFAIFILLLNRKSWFSFLAAIAVFASGMYIAIKVF